LRGVVTVSDEALHHGPATSLGVASARELRDASPSSGLAGTGTELDVYPATRSLWFGLEIGW